MSYHVARDWNHVTRLISVTAFPSRSRVEVRTIFDPDVICIRSTQPKLFVSPQKVKMRHSKTSKEPPMNPRTTPEDTPE